MSPPAEHRRRWRGGVAWLTLVAAFCVASFTTHGHAVDSDATAAPQSAALPAGEGSAIAGARCLTCHGRELLEQQRLSRTGWAREVEKMIGWGAAVQESERMPLIAYLAAHFGPPSSGMTDPPLHAGASLVAKRCLTCHGDEIIAQQRLNAAGWTREVEKMIGWGASVADQEKAVLVDYLALRWPVAPRPQPR